MKCIASTDEFRDQWAEQLAAHYGPRGWLWGRGRNQPEAAQENLPGALAGCRDECLLWFQKGRLMSGLVTLRYVLKGQIAGNCDRLA